MVCTLHMHTKYNQGKKANNAILSILLVGVVIGTIIPFITPDTIEIAALTLLIISTGKTAIAIILSSKNYSDYNNRKVKKNSDTPLVSILSPCFNEEFTIENSVKGLLKQTYTNFEIVIINDGSTDRTKEVVEELVKQFKNVRLLNKANGGKATALNYGLDNAKGEIVVRMDGDTVFKRDALQYLVDEIHR